MLVRGINRTALVLLVINSIIGAGIFGLPSKLYALAGVYSLLAFVVCAAVVAVYVLCFAEVSTRFRDTGGPYLYILKAFGPLPGFAMGWLLLLSRIFNYAVLINLFVTYLGALWHPATTAVNRIVIMLMVTTGFTVVNYFGVKSAARTSSFITVAKLLPLALFIAWGLLSLQPGRLTFQNPPTVSSFSEAVLLLVFAFGGFESALVNTGEIREPQKNLPVALFSGLAVVTVFYCGIQTVCIGTLPALGSSVRPVADAAGTFMGKGGVTLIVVGALVSIAGTLNVLMLSGSRLPFAFSQEGQLPGFFSFVHPRYATPALSLFVCAALCFLVSVAWSFGTALTVAVIIRVLMYGMVCAALLQLRRKDKQAKGHFSVKGGRWIAVSGILLSGLLLTASSLKEFRDVAICLLIGWAVYHGNRRFGKKAAIHS